MLGYIFNYKQIVLTADQKEYKITLNIQGVKVVKVVAQILAITYLANGYVYWLILEFLMGIATTVVIEYVLHREYPWLRPQPQLGGLLHKKHEEIIRKTKQIFFHRVGGFAFTQSSSIIIYAYASLSLVAVYGINAGIGNLVAENDKERTVSVFNELFSLRFYIVAVVCYGYYMLVGPFISLWIGEEYILDHTTLLLITAILFVDLVRNIIDSFNNAYGLFQDVWATVVEACINIGCSIWFGYLWGLPGILAGVLLSLLLIIFLWKPYFLFGWGFRISVLHYWKLYFKCFVAGAVAVVICMIMFFIMAVNSEGGYQLLYPGVVVVIFSVIFLLILCSINSSMRQGIGRILNLIRKC